MTGGSIEGRGVLCKVLVRVRIIYRLVWITLRELFTAFFPVLNVLRSGIFSEVRRFVDDSSSL
jgi:hypothetical protein